MTLPKESRRIPNDFRGGGTPVTVSLEDALFAWRLAVTYHRLLATSDWAVAEAHLRLLGLSLGLAERHVDDALAARVQP